MTDLGIGPVLEKARVIRGKTIEEASRETRIRPDYLRALERERFDALLGDVYVRGCLRSYSTYLGLDADGVLSVYKRHFGAPPPTLAEPDPAPVRTRPQTHPDLAGLVRRHPSWRFMGAIALVALAAFAAAGILTRSDSTPPGGPVPVRPSGVPAGAAIVEVALLAREPVYATVRADGDVEFRGVLRQDESRSFVADHRIDVLLSSGGVTELTVNGYALGTPGARELEYSETFGPNDYREEPSAPSR